MKAARGVTFLETVLAVVLLGLTTATVAMTVNYISSASMRNAHRMNAAEIANRLLLQFFDDPASLPSTTAPVEYGPEGEFRYRWSLGEEPAEVELPVPVNPSVEEDRRESQLAALGRSSRDRYSRFRVVRVKVWLSEETRGGSFFAESGVPQATASRLYDPADIPNWNPDKLRRQIDAGGLRGVLNQMSEGRGSLRPSIRQQEEERRTGPRSPTSPAGEGGAR